VSAHEVEEIRKRFFTMLLEGTRAIVWDNVVGDFDSAPMAGMLTSPEVSDRILSTSGSKTVPNRALLIFNGNNFVPVGDMSRRVLVCRIDPRTEAPHTRSFAVNPQEVCAKRRQEMVSAALTLIRLYIASGAAKEGDTGSFSAWDSWVRQTVIHVSRTISPEGYCDIGESFARNNGADPEAEQFGEFVRTWREVFADEWVSAKQIAEKLSGNNTMSPNLDNFKRSFLPLTHGDVTVATVGAALKLRADRMAAGLKLVFKQDSALNQKVWRVVVV
jgi:hypothetical protein